MWSWRAPLVHSAGVPSFQDLIPGTLRWWKFNNNRNKVCNKVMHLNNPPHPLALWSMEKLSSTKPVPGAKKGCKPLLRGLVFLVSSPVATCFVFKVWVIHFFHWSTTNWLTQLLIHNHWVTFPLLNLLHLWIVRPAKLPPLMTLGPSGSFGTPGPG